MGKISWDDYPTALVIYLLWNLVFFLPSFFLHLTYFYLNRKTQLTIDDSKGQYSIKDTGSQYDFTISDIQIVEQHLGIYFKNKIDNYGRFIMPWTGYGYIKVKLTNERTFYFSSLMLDLQLPPFPNSQAKFRALPFIDRHDLEVAETRKIIENEEQIKFNSYIEKFSNLPREILEEKVANPKQYEPAAIAASKKLLGIDSCDLK